MYERLLLNNGDVLNDFHINHIQEGISQIDRDVDSFKSTVVRILKAKGIPASIDENLDSLSQKINYLNTGYISNDSDDGESIEEIDIRKTVQSGEIQLLCSDVQSGYVEIAVWTSNASQYSVDWGDGTTDIVDNGQTIKHQYVAGIGGSPYRESNTQWIATIKAEGNIIYRFQTRNNSDILWFCSKDVYFEYMYAMFSGGANSINAPKAMKYFDLIGGALSCEREKNCGYVFRNCESLERISGTINLVGATHTNEMFFECKKLKQLPDILNLSSVQYAQSMFCNCYELQNIPNLVSTASLVNVSYMFKTCKKITELPAMDLSNAVQAAEFAGYCDMLEDIRKIRNTGGITDATGMFRDGLSLRYVPSTLDLGSALNPNYLFHNCTSLIDAPTVIHTGSATTLYRMFYGCKSMRTAPSSLIAPNATSTGELFYNCMALRSAPSVLVFPKTQGINSMFSQCKSLITAPEIMEFEECLDANDLFYGCDLLETPPREIIMPKVVNVYSMFNACLSLKSTPERMVLTSAQKVHNMFNGCRILTDMKLEELNLPQAITAYSLFNNCRSLTKAPRLILPKAQEVQNMFYLCERLTESHDVDLPVALNVDSFYRDCLSLEHAPAINAPMATRWGYVYNNDPILQSISSMPGPSAQNMDQFAYNSPKLMNLGTDVIDLTNVSVANNWYHTSDPMHLSGKITIRGGKCSFYIRNCRNLTSIRYENMDPLCGNLDFRNCAMEAESINLLFGDLIQTLTPATINVAGNPGAAGCDPTIATAKGWTVTI